MTTASATPIQDLVKDQVTETTIDLATRLELASIAMDVLLDITGGRALALAHDAVARAMAEADRYSTGARALQAVAPSTFTSHRILRQAGNVIRARGWHQGGLYGPDGAVCALEAIRIASGCQKGAEDAAVSVLIDRIRHETGRMNQTVPYWNDDTRRTRADILRLLW